MTALVGKNDHLLANRRMILAHAVASSAAGMMPLPLVDDWAQAAILRGAIRRIAESRGVDLDEAAIRALAQSPVTAPSWATLVSTVRFTRVVRRAYRTALFVVLLGRRAEQASRQFAACTLFDHYCTRLHVGAGLDEAGAREVRARIDTALADLPRGILPRLFQRGLAASGKALLRAPVELADTIRRLARRDRNVAEAEVEEAIAERGPGLRGVIRSVDQALGDASRAYFDELIDRFEKGFRS